MKLRNTVIVASLLAAAFAGCKASTSADAPSAAPQAAAPTAAPSAPPAGSAAAPSGVDVLLCDGETEVFVPQGTPATEVAGALMAEWLRKNPNKNWDQDVRERHGLVPAADNADLVGQGQGQTYGRITERDVALWKRETELFALAGSRVFHSGDELGSTIGVSCDMCHPHAANTHPETYPKFQKQLGRVVLLRDMINWCLEHPVRAPALDANDPRMRSLEAYIMAQRSGKTMEYGKH